MNTQGRHSQRYYLTKIFRQTMRIIKTDGSSQKFLPNKIIKRIKDQSFGLEVDEVKVFQKCVSGLVDGMTSKDVDNHIAITAANLIIEHPDYSILAGRIVLTRQGKMIGVEPVDSDFLFDFIGITSYLHKYSMKDDEGNPIELPHMTYKRVADYLYPTDKSLAKEYYDDLRYRNISVATPQLMNFGTGERGSGISCNITTLLEDSTDGILNTLNDISKSSRDGAGIGLHIHSLRSKESLVTSFKGYAGGVVRFADMVQSHMRFFKQGNRSGSAALYLGIWHRDIEDFLEMRLPVGDEKMRTRDLFTACCIPDLFMEKLNNSDDEWFVFCPHEVTKAGFKNLHDTHGDGFKKLYQDLVDSGLGRKTSVKKLWSMLTKSWAESGLPYTFYWDNANRNHPQSNIGVCRGFNLCIEYGGVSDSGYTSQCNLGLIPLHNLDKDDFDEIARRTKVVTRGLNRAIEVNKWSTESARKAGTEQRTIGIGIAGLADYLQNYGIPYDSEESKEFNYRLMKTIYESAYEESKKLVSEYGVYDKWEGSIYEQRGDEICNSLLVCLMPSASTSTLLSCTESFEVPHSNIFVRDLDSGSFVVTNKYLVRDLSKLGLWTKDIIDNIVANQGSIQQIEVIPDDIKKVYRTIWEIKMKDYIDVAAIRQKFIDQGQSMNLYFSDPTTGKIGAALNHSWKMGLPSGSYYIKTRSSLKNPVRLAIQDTTVSNAGLPERPDNSLFDCFNCSA